MENTLTAKDSSLVVKGIYHCPIYYEDTDFSGFVYHAAYLKFFERAREHLIGIKKIKELFSQHLHVVVHKLEINYHQPLSHGDYAVIHTAAKLKRGPRITFEHKLHRTTDDPTEIINQFDFDKSTLSVSATVHAALLQGSKIARLNGCDLFAVPTLPTS